MKKRTLKSILILVCSALTLGITEYVFVSVMKNCKEGTVGKINGIVSHELDFNLTIWGASTAYVNFNPQLIIDSLDITAFNMGIDGTNIDQYEGLLNEYIAYSQESKYLVIAVDLHQGLSDRESLYHFNNWAHHIDNKNIFNCFLDIDASKMKKLKYIPFYSLTQFDKHAFPIFRKNILNKQKEYFFPKHGFHPLNSNLKIEQTISKSFLSSINQRSFNKLKSAADKAVSRNIKTYIVITPCYSEGLKQITNSEEFISKVNTLNSNGIKVLDFSNSYISENIDFFSDNTHLNKKGADELTNLLISSLTRKKNTQNPIK